MEFQKKEQLTMGMLAVWPLERVKLGGGGGGGESCHVYTNKENG